jgi:hypothetical protein
MNEGVRGDERGCAVTNEGGDDRECLLQVEADVGVSEGGRAIAGSTAAASQRRSSSSYSSTSQQLCNDGGGANYGSSSSNDGYSYSNSSGNDAGTETGWAHLSKTEHARLRVGAMVCGGCNRVPEGCAGGGYKYSTVPPPSDYFFLINLVFLFTFC